MLIHPLSFLSGLAYLALCLLIACFCAWQKTLHFRNTQTEHGDTSGEFTVGQFSLQSEESPTFPTPSHQSIPSLFLSGLILLLTFLFLPCGILPAFLPIPYGAAFILVALFISLGIQTTFTAVKKEGQQRWPVPFCLSISIVSIASYAQQRGIPGELYSLDTYVAMPPIGVMGNVEKSGTILLALASLLALWKASPAGLTENKPADAKIVLLEALVSELWMLAAIGFWVCLFFPVSLMNDYRGGIAGIGNITVNTFFFWGKVLALNFLFFWSKDKFPMNRSFFTTLFVLLCAGVICLIFLGYS